MSQTHTITQWLQIAMDHHNHGRLREAEQIYRGILSKQPNNADAMHLLGVLAGHQNFPEQALDLIGKAIAIRPNVAAYHTNLAQALSLLDRREEALAELHKAVGLDASYFPTYYGLGTLLQSLDRNEEAIAAYQNALKLQPGNAQAHNNLGIVLRNAGRWDEAATELDEADRLLPNSAIVQTNLAMLRLDMARHEESIAASDRAMELEAPTTDRLSGRISAMHYDPRFGAADILAQARRFDELFARPLATSIAPHKNDRDPNRKLRIGYVSPDLRNHVVGRCMLSILANRDPSQFQIFCYPSVANEDSVSTQIRQRCDAWRNIETFDDDSAAEAIREDEIDILVDLAVHTQGNRLAVFARKPAPVQMTYLGCCSTTGLSTIDYRISDAHADPAEIDLTQYSERTLRLPGVHFCYDPAPGMPEVSALPSRATGFITFGCLNYFTKCSTAAIDAWIQILRQVPKSRLVLHCPPGKHLEPLRERFEAAGIGRERLEFVGKVGSAEFFQTYTRVDLALDPFPYNGAITTCDALWMGIPVVTLSGKTAVGRMGRSILSNIDLGELIAGSGEEYIRRAVDWAGDLDRLARLRGELRGRMRSSALMKPHQLARNLELAYREVWRSYCGIGAAS